MPTGAAQQPVPSPTAAEPAAIPTDELSQAPDRDLYDLARALVLKTAEPVPIMANPRPVSYEEGRQDTFWLADLDDLAAYTRRATLELVSSHAYWYVEEGRRVSRRDLERAARVFEEEIYPRVTAAFGTEWSPGVDNDPHLTILHAHLRGASGYFSTIDEYPKEVHQHSNEREMVYIDIGSLAVGTREYLSVLSHELQHAVHWNGDRTEESWINEGLSEVASSVAGYKPANLSAFLSFPNVSLVNWPDHLAPYYGASFLFFDYLVSHYGNRDDLSALVREPADDIQGLNSYLARLGHDVTFRDVFRDWVVANFLDEPGDGTYSHPGKDARVRAVARMDGFGQRESSIPQYSAEYTAIDIFKGDVRVRFQGQGENSLLPVTTESEGCWWSNRGDSISSTLTRPLDLSGVESATLRFRVWFEVEKEWDYGYVEVSRDEGVTWDIIEAPGTSPRNPLGNSFGHGYTGESGSWLEAEVDLTAYAGQRVLLRFHYVTDGAINRSGLCLDRISVPEIGFADTGMESDGWQVDGFVLTDNIVPQEYIVQVIEVGDENVVREMVLDETNRGEVVVTGLEHLDDLVVVVAALAPKTLQDASYILALEPVS